MMTKQETRVGDGEKAFSSLGTGCPQTDGIHLDMYRQTVKEEDERRLKQTPSPPAVVPRTRKNIPAALNHGGKVKARQ